MSIGLRYVQIPSNCTRAFANKIFNCKVSSLFRVPLNIFVVVSLLTGVSSARKAVLTVSSLLLALSCVMMGKVVLEAEKRTQAENIDARNGTAH